jgi:hypothetical protein
MQSVIHSTVTKCLLCAGPTVSIQQLPRLIGSQPTWGSQFCYGNGFVPCECNTAGSECICCVNPFCYMHRKAWKVWIVSRDTVWATGRTFFLPPFLLLCSFYIFFNDHYDFWNIKTQNPWLSGREKSNHETQVLDPMRVRGPPESSLSVAGGP